MLGLEDFRLLPAGTPPHRAKPAASPEHRLAMLRIATGGHTELTVDDREIRRTGKSYMVDTLAELREESGSAPLILVIGQDAANELDSWHEWRTIFEVAHLVIMRRPKSVAEWSGVVRPHVEKRLVNHPARLQKEPAGLVLPLELTQLAISSTDIRERLVSHKSPRFLLPDPVIDYIVENRLYFAGEAGKG